jgi:DNA-binding beta-propeller fold protein YncE
MSKIVKNKKDRIKKDTREMEATMIPKYRRKYAETESEISETTIRYDELEEETDKLRAAWHREVDAIFNKLRSFLKATKDSHISPMKTNQSKLGHFISEMIQTVKENKEIVQSNKVLEVMNYSWKFTEYSNIPKYIQKKIPSLKTNTVPGKELRVELGRYKAKLSQISRTSIDIEASTLPIGKSPSNAVVVATMPTRYEPLYRVACVGKDEALVSGKNKTIGRFQIPGTEKETVTVPCLTWPSDISVTREGDLLYTDSYNGSVNIVRGGKTKTLITTPEGWYPEGLCCTPSGDVLVSMSTTDFSHCKIVRYRGQNVEQEIEKDDDGESIYKGGDNMLFVEENNNGDVCTSDINSQTVVVVDRSGRVRFRYDGAPAGRKESFSPVQIVTDAAGRIIVADYSNDCLHVLDPDGQFLLCVDNCGLDKPFGLSIDTTGRLWVGLAESGELKVIQYNTGAQK